MSRQRIRCTGLVLSLGLALLAGGCGREGGGSAAGDQLLALNDGSTESRSYTYLVGAGIYDIMGPTVGIIIDGGAAFGSNQEGLWMRPRSRAFIIQERATGKRIVLISNDVGYTSQAVQLEVIRRLEKLYGNAYTEQNVLVGATHNHYNPGGFDGHWGLGLFMGGGFSEENFQAIVTGTVEAVKRAHANLEPARIVMGYGAGSYKVGERFSHNRSPIAYANNPKEEIERYKNPDGSLDNVNRFITTLDFISRDGRQIGRYSWVAAHNHVGVLNVGDTVAFGTDKLQHGAQTGYAEYLMEKARGTNYDAAKTFVVANAMNDAADSEGLLPEFTTQKTPPLTGPVSSVYDYQYVKKVGTIIAGDVERISSQATTELTGGIDSRLMYVRFPGFKIDPAYIDPGEVKYSKLPNIMEDINNIRVAEPVIGLSMLLFSFDGNKPLARDVTRDDDLPWDKVLAFMQDPLASAPLDLIWLAFFPQNTIRDRKAHLEKINLLPVGSLKSSISPFAYPDLLPIQVIRIGPLAVVNIPFEFTTMAGRRLRRDILQVMPGIEHVEITTNANSYDNYVSTRDEYAIQQYEGGSNLFGPYTCNAIRQMACELAKSMVMQAPMPGYALDIRDVIDPIEMVRRYQNKVGTVSYDSVPSGSRFGDVITEPAASYSRGQSAWAQFWGGHPNNNLQTQSSYLFIERWTENGWVTVARDYEPSTYLRCQREDHQNTITIEWVIPEDALPGQYRIRHQGFWKAQNTCKLSPYQGVSRSFIVQLEAVDPAAVKEELRGYIENVTEATGWQYNVKDSTGQPMHCLKVIADSAGGYLGVYHCRPADKWSTRVATSNDLLNWTFRKELAVNGSQPTIKASSDGGFVVAWEQEPGNHLEFAYFASLDDLLSGSPKKTFKTKRKLSACAEGTPNIYACDSKSVDFGFHYFSSGDIPLPFLCLVDRQARGTLRWSNSFWPWSWQARKERQIDAALLKYGLKGNIGDRDDIRFKGFDFLLVEGMAEFNDFSTWSTYLYDVQSEQADKLAIRTHQGSTSFGNQTITDLTLPNGQRALVMSAIIFNGPAAETGQLIYYRIYE